MILLCVLATYSISWSFHLHFVLSAPLPYTPHLFWLSPLSLVTAIVCLLQVLSISLSSLLFFFFFWLVVFSTHLDLFSLGLLSSALPSHIHPVALPIFLLLSILFHHFLNSLQWVLFNCLLFCCYPTPVLPSYITLLVLTLLFHLHAWNSWPSLWMPLCHKGGCRHNRWSTPHTFWLLTKNAQLVGLLIDPASTCSELKHECICQITKQLKHD